MVLTRLIGGQVLRLPSVTVIDEPRVWYGYVKMVINRSAKGGFGSRIVGGYRTARTNAETNLRRDSEALRTLPGGRRSVFLAALCVTALFSLFRVGVLEIYTESLLFLLLVVTLGLLGWTVGLLVIALHVVFDLVAFVLTPPWIERPLITDVTVGTLLGRFISFVLLFVLVVMIPSAQRFVHARLLAHGWERPHVRFVSAAASVVTVGVLVYLWTVIAPYVTRGVFIYSSFYRYPPVLVIEPLEDQGILLALGAAVVAAGVAVGYQQRVGIANTIPVLEHAPTIGSRVLRRGLRYLVVLVVLSPLLTNSLGEPGVLDVLLLAGALVGAELLVLGASRSSAGTRLRSIPWIVRLSVASVAVFVAVSLIFDRLYDAWLFAYARPDVLADSEFLPIVLGLVVGVVLFRLALGVDDYVEPYIEYRSTGVSQPVVRPLAIGLLCVIVLLAIATDVAVAHHCSNLADCDAASRGAQAAAITATAAACCSGRSIVPITAPDVDPGQAGAGAASAAAPTRAAGEIRTPGAISEYTAVTSEAVMTERETTGFMQTLTNLWGQTAAALQGEPSEPSDGDTDDEDDQ